MTLDEGIIHAEEVAESKRKQVENGDWEKGSSTERDCIECAEEHEQLAEWLKELKELRVRYSQLRRDCNETIDVIGKLRDELKAYRDARAEINQALYDDARGEQNDYERGRKSGIFLCESIISVKLGESSSENPNTCEDAISRQAVLDVTWEEPSYTDALNVLTEIRDKVKVLPSVTPQQRTGRWERMSDLPNDVDDRFKCSHCGNIVHYNNVMDLRTFSRWCGRCGFDNG